jgi:hypothetical protein
MIAEHQPLKIHLISTRPIRAGYCNIEQPQVNPKLGPVVGDLAKGVADGLVF